MDLLKQRIIDDGIIVSTEIVKVDSFLNQQLDVKLFEEIGKEIRKLYSWNNEEDKLINN